jgi:hypothetical protein
MRIDGLVAAGQHSPDRQSHPYAVDLAPGGGGRVFDLDAIGRAVAVSGRTVVGTVWTGIATSPATRAVAWTLP